MGVSIHGVSSGSVVTKVGTYMNSVKNVVYIKKVRRKENIASVLGGYRERPGFHKSSTMALILPYIRNFTGREALFLCRTRVIRRSDVREAGIISTSSAQGRPCHRNHFLVGDNWCACVRCSRSCCPIGDACRRLRLMIVMSRGCCDRCHVGDSWGSSCPWYSSAMAHTWNASHWS